MKAGVGGHLGQIVAAAIAVGFESAKLHREVRRRGDHHLWGWALDIGPGGTSPADACFFILEAVLEADGEAYAAEVIRLVALWARSGVPPWDQPPPTADVVIEELCGLLAPHARRGELAAETLARVLEGQ